VSGEIWAFIFLFLILKIPVCAALYLVWWSSRSSTAPADGEPARVIGGGDGPVHPRPHRPRPPRRGPHRGPVPASPRRTRAIARRITRTHR
jgi:hypothetical protein